MRLKPIGLQLFVVITSCILLVIVSPVSGAFNLTGNGVRPLGMGGAFTGVADDANALDLNPAGLAQVRGIELLATYFQAFGMAALQNSKVNLLYTAPWGSIGGGYQNFGKSDYYKEEVISLGYGRRLNKRLLAGFSLKYQALHIMPLYGSDWALGADLGLLWSFSRRVRMGLYLQNINLPNVGIKEETLPVSGRLGLALYPKQDLLIAIDAYKEKYYPLQLKVGQELRLFNHLFLRAGVQTEPARFSVGGSVQMKFFAADYAYGSHPVLGGTHQVGIRLTSQPR
jgi:hypothetical protein